MADLTEEQKIIIGVCVGIAGLIILAIIVFICCYFYTKDRRRRRYGYKDDLIPDRYDRNDRYPVYEKEVPAVIYDAPPPLPMWREPVYSKRPRSIEMPYKYDTWDKYSEPPRKYYDDRWDGGYRNEPIVVPVAEPDYVPSRAIQAREPDTIYLRSTRPMMRYMTDRDLRNLREQSRPVRYVDDQALLSRNNYARRSEYYGGGEGVAPLRRSRSFHDVRGGSAYIGEWGRRPEYPSQFNERALKAGHDPFLWK